jgi:hypothetical protein
MPGAFLTEDLEHLMRTDEFADSVVVSGGAGAGVTFRAIFDEDYIDVLGVGSVGPALTCRTVDVQSHNETTRYTIRGLTYKIVEPQPDDSGVRVLRLHRAS